MPDWDAATVDALVGRLRLALDPRRRRHGAGSHLGHGPGASLEFHDHRPYVPGDDLRHIDWNVLARSDQLVLRRYRVEVSPRVEVLVDGSASSALSGAKSRTVAGLAALITGLAEAGGGRPRLWWCGGDGPQRLDGGGAGAWRARLRAARPAGASGFGSRAPALSAGAERVLISDGLERAGAAAVVRRYAAGAGRICLLQVLTAAERDPGTPGGLRLQDVEGGERDLILDAAACATYRQRLARLIESWQRELRGRGAGVIDCDADADLATVVGALLAAGVVEVGS